MSFSSKVKAEMADIIPAARHCCIAETAALIAVSSDVDGGTLVFTGDSESFRKKLFTLLKKTYNIEQYGDSKELLPVQAEEVLGSVHFSEMTDGRGSELL